MRPEGYKVASGIARDGAAAGPFGLVGLGELEAHYAILYNAAIMASHGVRVSFNPTERLAKAPLLGGGQGDEVRQRERDRRSSKMITLYFEPGSWGTFKVVVPWKSAKMPSIAIFFSSDPFAPETRCEMTFVDG